MLMISAIPRTNPTMATGIAKLIVAVRIREIRKLDGNLILSALDREYRAFFLPNNTIGATL